MANPALRWLHNAWRGNASLQNDIVRGYHQSFGDPDKAHVEDFATFCFVRDTTTVPGDPYLSAVHEGRRQAYLHVINMLQITQAEIAALNTGKVEDNGRGPDDDRNGSSKPNAGRE